jgi:hypothetical protein
MHAIELCRRYQEALTQRDFPAVLTLFAPDATVQAPITGTMSAEEFHHHLFNGSSMAIARLIHVFEGIGEPRKIALQFSYTWVISDSSVEVMDGVSIFQMDDGDSMKFKSLTIIYDPTNLKRHLNDDQISSTSLG